MSTTTVEGRVTDETGVLPGVTVTARDLQSGLTREAVTEADGRFTLAGLRPGTYGITATLAPFKPQARTVQLLVGQTVSVDFTLRSDLAFAEAVTVVSERVRDIKTTGITTNVTQEQLLYLPQNSRNFLNFAALAPGLRVSDDETRKEFSAGALPSQNVNVFIDGVSYKNDVIDGGIVGQDASRGNPFPQNAVQEFQVLTQNFKAEYREGGKRHYHGHHEEWRQPVSRRTVQLLSGQGPGRRTRPSSGTHRICSSRARPLRSQNTNAGSGVPPSGGHHRQEQGAVLPLV